MSPPPILFRLTIEVGDLDQAARFYAQLLGVNGDQKPGQRVYFSCGPTTLQVLLVLDRAPHPSAKSLYFEVADLDATHARARALQCTSDELVHGERGGDIGVRPWGERSFYAEDPWKNSLCFVERGSAFR